MYRRVLIASLLAALIAAGSPQSRAQVSATVRICGVVTVYVPATVATAGAITIGLVPFVIAPGVTIEGHEEIQIGVDMCLSATLNASAQIVLPSSIVVNATAEVTVCGTVTAYVAATAVATGSISIGGVTYQIAAGTVITNDTLIVVGVSLCLQATVNALAQIVAGVVTPGEGNHPPAIDAPDSATARVGETLRFTVTATDPDGGDTVTLEATALPAGATATPNPATGNPASLQFSFTPSPSQAGQTVSATFAAGDGNGGTASEVVQISVTSGGGGGGGNGAPTISVPGPQTVAAGQTLAFTVTASDPDGDPVTLSASDLPQNASFDPSTGAFTFTPSESQIGQSFTVTFTATDSAGASTSAGVTISVTGGGGGGADGPPVVSVPPSPIVVTVGDTLVFVVTGTSPIANCSVTLDATRVPPNATFDAESGTFRFVPTAAQAGRSFTVTFTATDCQGQSSSATVTIEVVGGGGGSVGGTACVSVTRIQFSPVPIGGGCGYAVITLANAGRDPLAVEGFAFDDGAQFAVGNVATPTMLLPGNVREIRIAFVPTRAGNHKDILRITTSDRERRAVVIRLSGRALAR